MERSNPKGYPYEVSPILGPTDGPPSATGAGCLSCHGPPSPCCVRLLRLLATRAARHAKYERRRSERRQPQGSATTQ